MDYGYKDYEESSYENEDFAGRIRNSYHSLTKTQKKIANFILNNEDFVLKSSITVVANKIGTNPASITRFCQSLRYKGFNELKFYIENHILMLPEKTEGVKKDDSLLVSIKKITKFELEALNDTVTLVDEREVQRAVNAICKSGKVYFYGEGGTGSSAQSAYYLFMQIGVTSNCFTSSNLMLMSTTHLQKGDVVIGMSFSGRAQGVIEALNLIREKQPGVTVIAITAFPNSPITKLSNINLFYSCNIYDDLQYLHVARMCEISIIGILQAGIVNYMANINESNMSSLKYAITSKRTK